MSYNTFDSCRPNLSFALKKDKYYRSSFAHSYGRFCFEFTWQSGPGFHQVGFSNTMNSRSFIAYYHGGGVAQFFERPTGSSTISSISFVLGETGMVCIDTSIKKISFVRNDESIYREYPTFPDNGEWFTYLDHGNNEQISIIEINLRYHPFKNVIPCGYSSWISFTKCGCSVVHVFFHQYISLILYYNILISS